MGAETYALSHSTSKVEDAEKLGVKRENFIVAKDVKETVKQWSNTFDIILITAPSDNLPLDSLYFKLMAHLGSIMCVLLSAPPRPLLPRAVSDPFPCRLAASAPSPRPSSRRSTLTRSSASRSRSPARSSAARPRSPSCSTSPPSTTSRHGPRLALCRRRRRCARAPSLSLAHPSAPRSSLSSLAARAPPSLPHQDSRLTRCASSHPSLADPPGHGGRQGPLPLRPLEQEAVDPPPRPLAAVEH